MANSPKQNTYNILLVEDNPGDVRLTQEALKECESDIKLSVAKDGDEALDFLYKKGEYAEAPRPDIILLDLNLPKKNGKEVLEDIKQNIDLKTIPVIMLTTSKAVSDIRETYKLHVNCFVAKPLDIEEFIDVIKSIESFWLKLSELPSVD